MPSGSIRSPSIEEPESSTSSSNVTPRPKLIEAPPQEQPSSLHSQGPPGFKNKSKSSSSSSGVGHSHISSRSGLPVGSYVSSAPGGVPLGSHTGYGSSIINQGIRPGPGSYSAVDSRAPALPRSYSAVDSRAPAPPRSYSAVDSRAPAPPRSAPTTSPPSINPKSKGKVSSKTEADKFTEKCAARANLVRDKLQSMSSFGAETGAGSSGHARSDSHSSTTKHSSKSENTDPRVDRDRHDNSGGKSKSELPSVSGMVAKLSFGISQSMGGPEMPKDIPRRLDQAREKRR